MNLQEIRNVWYNEPLNIDFILDTGENIRTYSDYIKSFRIQSCFSVLHLTPELGSLTLEQALNYDNEINKEAFGVENPLEIIQEFDEKLENISSEKLECLIKIIKNIHSDSLDLEQHETDATVKQAFMADAQASAIILSLLEELKVSHEN